MGRKQSPANVAEVSYFVYIGPTIKSFVQHNTILEGTLDEVKASLASAIEKYPPIAQLLVSGNDLAEARKQIKQPGNRLYEVCRRLSVLLNTNGG